MDRILINNLTLELPTLIAAVNMFLGKSSGDNIEKEKLLYNITLWEEDWQCGIPPAMLQRKLRAAGTKLLEAGIVELRNVLYDILGDDPKFIEIGFIEQLDDTTVHFTVMDFTPGNDDKRHQ